MSREQRTVEVVRNEIISAIAEVRRVAHSEQDKHRNYTADWLDAQFSCVTDRSSLRSAAARALEVYRGGMGSFHDVGTAAQSHAVRRLYTALRRGRSWFLRNS